MVQIFVSYSHKDQHYVAKNELIDFLQTNLKNKAKFWYDRNILAGEYWNSKIQKNILESQIAILLVSKHFLDSKYIVKQEVEKFFTATIQKFEVVPIILSPCKIKKIKWLPSIQHIPEGNRSIEKDFRTKAQRRTLYKQILTVLKSHIKYVRKPEIESGKAISGLINLFNTIETELLEVCRLNGLIGNQHRLMFEGRLKDFLVKEKRGNLVSEKLTPVSFKDLYKTLPPAERKKVKGIDKRLSAKYSEWLELDARSLESKSDRAYRTIESKKHALIRTMFTDLMTMLVLIHKGGLVLDDHYISIYRAMGAMNKTKSMFVF
jgi:TIR domain